jgi:1-acyl-sn-glycerol-3-phosphate acyltransferase
VLRGFFATLALIVFTVLFAAPAALIGLLNRRSDLTMLMGRGWSRGMLFATGARVTYHGLEHLEGLGPCIYVSNHQSNVDIWALIRILPLSTRFVAKESLFHVPILGWAMAAAGFVPIDRGNHNKAIQSLGRAARAIRGGRSLVLFPEGTRSRSGELAPFKKGPFHLALQVGVPVVPVAVKGSGRVLPPHSIRVTPGPVEVRILAPVDIRPFLPNDQRALRLEVRARIAAALGAAAATGDDSSAAAASADAR